MKVAIVSSSALQQAGRWDAEFHVLANTLSECASSLRSEIDEDRAMEMLGDLRTADLKGLVPLTRSKRADRADILKAAEEFPHLALAIVRQDMAGILPAAVHDVELKQRYLDTVTAIAETLHAGSGMRP